jgi:hypothetical protein
VRWRVPGSFAALRMTARMGNGRGRGKPDDGEDRVRQGQTQIPFGDDN